MLWVQAADVFQEEWGSHAPLEMKQKRSGGRYAYGLLFLSNATALSTHVLPKQLSLVKVQLLIQGVWVGAQNEHSQ